MPERQAIATARRLGAQVSATDVRSATKEQIQSLGKSNPATVAQLIQTWMDEDRRN